MIAQVLKNFRIKQKLLIINLCTSGATLLLAGAVLLLNEYYSTRGTMIYNLTSLTEILANNSAAPLVFNDQKAAVETLRALRASPNIEMAIVYDKEGRVFADYRRADGKMPFPAAPVATGHSFGFNYLNIFQKISLDRELVGTIYIRSNIEMLYSMMIRNGIIAAITMTIVFGIAVILLLKLQKVITEPISDLELIMRNISRTRDYTLKANVECEDEIGSLAKGFNEMLEEIRKRDMQLHIEIIERKRAQAELVHNEKLAMLGLIAGGMGNELRNPLGVMNNAVYYLKCILTDADESIREYLEIIRQEIDNSLHIITDLLDFSRLKPPLKKPVQAHELITKCLEKSTIPENVSVRTELAEPLPELNVDPFQIQQVLLNIVDNAVLAMPAGGVLCIGARKERGTGNKEQGAESENFELRTSPLELDAEYVVICIADDGEGIAPENMGKLFQPLFTTRSRGIGLGLALSKKFVEANEGRIEVQSRQGVGTTFIIKFPIERGRE